MCLKCTLILAQQGYLTSDSCNCTVNDCDCYGIWLDSLAS